MRKLLGGGRCNGDPPSEKIAMNVFPKLLPQKARDNLVAFEELVLKLLQYGTRLFSLIPILW